MSQVSQIGLWGCSLIVIVIVIVCFGNVMSPHQSGQMSQRLQVYGIVLWGCSLNVFDIFFLLDRSCPLITLIKCLKGHRSLVSLFFRVFSKCFCGCLCLFHCLCLCHYLFVGQITYIYQNIPQFTLIYLNLLQVNLNVHQFTSN